jgi:hypothetical protein
MGNPIGNFASDSAEPAVTAISTGQPSVGMFGTCSGGTGVLGISTLAGVDQPLNGVLKPGGSGVVGENGQVVGFGVMGNAWGAIGTGVQGNGTGFGVQGNATAADGTGVEGNATGGVGVSANSQTGIALAVGSEGSFDAPQVLVVQLNDTDYARIRLQAENADGWDIAAGVNGPNEVFNIYSLKSESNVLTANSSGHVTFAGKVIQSSSRALKCNIRELSFGDANLAFAGLCPVQYDLRSDEEHSPCIGFIAEDMPELIAAPDGKTVCQMDIVAILTKVVHQLRTQNVDLAERVAALEGSRAHTTPA